MLGRPGTTKSFHVSFPINNPTLHCCSIPTVPVLAWLICCGTTVFSRHGSITFLAIHQKTSSRQTPARPLVHSGTKLILMASSNSRLHVLPFSKNYYSFFSLHSEYLQAGNPRMSNSRADIINLHHHHHL